MATKKPRRNTMTKRTTKAKAKVDEPVEVIEKKPDNADKLFELKMVCGHKLWTEKRPNPRKVWPDPQMCPTCKRKERVGEILHPILPPAKNLTAPLAPKKYKDKLARAAKKGRPSAA